MTDSVSRRSRGSKALGFCAVGEGGRFIEGGKRIALDGELPLNTFGGQLGAGRLHGFGFAHEAVVQLRGLGGKRQIAGDPRWRSPRPAAARSQPLCCWRGIDAGASEPPSTNYRVTGAACG